MGLFGFNKYLPIALELGTRTIRLLQLQHVGDTVRVAAADSWQYPKSLAEDSDERQRAAVEAVRRMLRSGGFKGRRVVTALSSAQLEIKNVRLPKMPPAQLDEAVWAEAAERYDFSVAGNQLNYLDAGEVRNGNETQREIIMMAASAEVIDEHVSMVAGMGLAPEHVDAEPVALFRMYERFLHRRSDDAAVTVAVDVGYTCTRVVVSRGRDIVFIKAVDIGSGGFTEAVARHASLDDEEARDLRKRASCQNTEGDCAPGEGGGGPERSSVDWTIRDALRSEVEALAREVGLCLRYCSVTFRGLKPQRINLTGGEACDATFVEMFREHLNMECHVSDPLRGIDSAGVDPGAQHGCVSAGWAICVGLAVRTAGPGEFGEEGDNEQRRLSA